MGETQEPYGDVTVTDSSVLGLPSVLAVEDSLSLTRVEVCNLTVAHGPHSNSAEPA